MGSSASRGRRGGAETGAAEAGATLPGPVSVHRHSLTCIHFFGRGGELIVTASEDRSVRIWDTGQEAKYGKAWELHGLLDSHARAVADASAATAGARRLRILRCPLEGHAQEGHQHWVTCLDMDLNGSVLYSGSMDKTVKAWDMYTGRCMWTYSGHSDWVIGIMVRGRVLYSAAEDGCVRLWRLCTLMDTKTAHQQPGVDEVECWEEHKASIKQMVQVGDHLLTADLNGHVKYWDLAAGRLLASQATKIGVVTCLAAPYHDLERQEMADRQGGKRVAAVGGTEQVGITYFVGGSAGVVQRRDLGQHPRDAVMQEYQGHRGSILCCEVVDGTLFTGSEDKSVRAWSVETGKCLQIYEGHLSGVRFLHVFREGVLCTGANDVRLWHCDSGDVLHVLAWKRADTLTIKNDFVWTGFSGQVREFCVGGWLRGVLPPAEKAKKGGSVGVLQPMISLVRPGSPPPALAEAAAGNAKEGSKAVMNGARSKVNGTR